jgi:hypothetical protein
MERGWQRCCAIIFACTALPGEEKDVGSCVPKSDELVTSSSSSSPAERFGGFPGIPVAFMSFLSDGALARVLPPLSYPEFCPAFLPTDGVLLVRRPISGWSSREYADTCNLFHRTVS